MGSNPIVKSTAIGVVLQLAMVLLGKAVPSLGAMPNFFAICGTVVAALTGAIAGRATTGTAGAAATSGAAAGGASSVVGGLLAVATGQWPGFAVAQLLFPAISGAAGGGIGGVISKMMKARPSTA
ncbi:MAG: hypothetical protein IT355_06910 [Gemmatimonadaceae bacterium]|nr:hypothetical protein [Gemmatimonadaceae bacterium]